MDLVGLLDLLGFLVWWTLYYCIGPLVIVLDWTC